LSDDNRVWVLIFYPMTSYVVRVLMWCSIWRCQTGASWHWAWQSPV